jgi:hypothetical protein
MHRRNSFIRSPRRDSAMERRRHSEAEYLGGLEVEDQLDLGLDLLAGGSARLSPLRIRPV